MPLGLELGIFKNRVALFSTSSVAPLPQKIGWHLFRQHLFRHLFRKSGGTSSGHLFRQLRRLFRTSSGRLYCFGIARASHVRRGDALEEKGAAPKSGP